MPRAEQCGAATLSAYLGRLALCVEPAFAHPAVAAGNLEGHDHSIARTDLGDITTNLEHNSHCLVAQYVTRAHEGAHRLVQVEIGSAELVLVTLMIASFGFLMTGSATSSTEMSGKPCQVTAFIRYVLRQSSLVKCEPA
jgi:hypothetical protein